MVLPPLDLGPDGAALALARAAWLAGLLSVAGALLFRALEPPLAATLAARILRLVRRSLGIAGLGWLFWVALQVAALSGADGVAAWWRAVPLVLGGSAFGTIALAQAGLVAVTAAALAARRLPRFLPAIPALGAVLLQVGHLHAWAMEAGPGLLTAGASVHVLGAAAWLGGLLPLRIVVQGSAPALAAAASRRFSLRASVFVAMVAAGALIQGSELLGGVPGIVGTAYGWVVMGKLLLLAGLLAMATSNRFRLTPALARPEPRDAHRALGRSIGRETVAGLLVVVAACLLSRLQPGMHAQPLWPFAVQPSLVTVAEDPAFAREAMLAALAVLLALALLVRAALRRRLRWPALAAAAATLWLALPHLDLLLIPAYPTSFYRSPTGFAATSIADGAALYPANCAACHGADGRGDGPQAAGLPVPPADLTAAHLWMHPDGELFWWLGHGMAAPDGGLAMPGFAAKLDDDSLWHLIDFIRARNAGLARRAGGAWPLPLQAPELDADCTGGRTRSLAELRGRPVRLAFQASTGAAPPPAPPGSALTTVFVPLPDATEAAGGDCIASDPSVTAAYSVITGLSPAQLAGSEVLIDANGWVRDVLRPGAPGALAAALRRVATPLPAGGGGMPMPMPAPG